ncbi:MAG: prephenate dehydrogenase [Ruminococcaceae bacterium]|nr:prephenate dehydrogenase [Oscillospiraceae bacterium]
MKINKNTKFLIIGLGLMGGSYARALTKKGYTVNAITKDQSSIDFAIENKIINYGTTAVEEELIKNTDVVIFALYPHVFTEWLEKYQHLFKPGTVLTDVTGVKTSVISQIDAIIRDDIEFIAAHPMAGREVYGVENSDDAIFKNANYIVVPTEKNSSESIALCKELGSILGFAKISELSPEKHDEMIAFLSQLTHCIAVCLMTCNQSDNMQDYTGDSFRDLTRIAQINEYMWSELFLMNKEPLLQMMRIFRDDFDKLTGYIEADDKQAIMDMMRISTERRKLFNK